MSLTFDFSDFEAGMRRLVDEVERETPRAVEQGMTAIERRFRILAKKLTGEYSQSWESLPPQRTGEGVEARGGPTVLYARKQERRNRTVQRALDSGGPEVTDALADGWRRAVT